MTPLNNSAPGQVLTLLSQAAAKGEPCPTNAASLTFVLPKPPSVNNLYANVPGRGRVKTRSYRRWRQDAAWAMKLDGNTARTWSTISGPVEIEIVSGNRRGDLDNGIKAVFDLLVSMRVIGNDKQVERHQVSRGGNPKEAVVTVREIGEAA